MSYKIIDSLHQEIGKTIASERFLNTMDGFWFALKPNVIINSFDFVTVDNLFVSKTIGIVKELQAAISEHDYDYNHYLSNNHTISRTKEQLNKKENYQKNWCFLVSKQCSPSSTTNPLKLKARLEQNKYQR